MLKKLTALLTVFVFCILMIQPTMTYAGWTDDLVDNITGRVKEILDTINDAKESISDNKIKSMISDVRTMLSQAVSTQQEGLSDFLAGGCEAGNLSSPCGQFRADLKSFLQNIEDLNNEFLSFHSIPALDIQFEDPGLKNLIDAIPGPILFPLYKVLMKLEIFDSGLIETLEDAKNDLSILKMVVFENEASVSPGSWATDAAIEVDACGFVNENTGIVKGAGYTVLGAGAIARIIGAILDMMSETVFSGPVEMDAGIHGYVHGTIHQNTYHTVAAIFNGAGSVLMPIGNYALNKVKFCAIELRQETMMLNQEMILANQDELLLGQRRVLCAFKKNLPAECAEFVGNGFGNRGRYIEKPWKP